MSFVLYTIIMWLLNKLIAVIKESILELLARAWHYFCIVNKWLQTPRLNNIYKASYYLVKFLSC